MKLFFKSIILERPNIEQVLILGSILYTENSLVLFFDLLLFFLRELPFELRKVFDKEEIEVKVEDKKDKVYLSSKKPMFHPFSGHGYRLGR